MKIPFLKAHVAGVSGFVRAALFSAVLTALIVLGVFFLPGKLQGMDLTRVLRPKPPAWQGVLHVWQVNTWRVGRGSRTAIVQAAARRYEARNVGIFIELENVSEDMLKRRLAEGDRPDVLLFPDDWAGMDATQFQSLEGACLPALAAPFDAAARADSRAVPWMAGGQIVLVNASMCRAAGLEPPTADKTWTTQALLDFARTAATTRRRKPALAISSTPSAWLPLAMQAVDVQSLNAKKLLAEDAFSLSMDSARQSFAGGRCAVLLGTQWEAGVMERLAARGKAFEYALLPPPADVRSCLDIQYAAAYDTGDVARNGAAAAFVSTLLSAPVQKAIAENSGCLAVVPNATDKPPESDIDKLLLAQQASAHVPLPWHTVDAGRITQALGGDHSAALLLGQSFAN